MWKLLSWIIFNLNKPEANKQFYMQINSRLNKTSGIEGKKKTPSEPKKKENSKLQAELFRIFANIKPLFLTFLNANWKCLSDMRTHFMLIRFWPSFQSKFEYKDKAKDWWFRATCDSLGKKTRNSPMCSLVNKIECNLFIWVWEIKNQFDMHDMWDFFAEP